MELIHVQRQHYYAGYGELETVHVMMVGSILEAFVVVFVYAYASGVAAEVVA